MELLIVANDAAIRADLLALFPPPGDAAAVADTAVEAVWAVALQRYDLALIDMRLPSADLVALVRRMRRLGGAMALLVCCRGTPAAVRVGLCDAGADVVCDPPPGPQELRARVQALLRRRPVGGPPPRRLLALV
ncbi:MAG: hypothetical protein M0Z28_25070 [Rhodospirillales bacterium]|nr:hypothetical protein [Rhodospirillales bacterium]